jgi:mitofusin
VLNVYKKELHLHVETGLGSNLKARLSTALAMNMEASQREMTERMEILLPPDHKATSNIIMPRRQPFEILYRLNCDNLCADFHEDLEFQVSNLIILHQIIIKPDRIDRNSDLTIAFRFSWGITTLIQKFAGSGANLLA